MIDFRSQRSDVRHQNSGFRYKKLYNGIKIKFDLTCGGNKCSFEYNPDYSISSKMEFIREVYVK